MALPQMSDYQAALQFPEFCFHDKSIQNCKCETNAFGVPKAAAGNFALTYCLYNSKSRWAIRCFHRETQGLEQRYAVISSYLKQNPLTYFSQFEYQNHGIRVNGSLYPIVKMEWLYGEPLNLYIAKNLRNSQQLSRLSDEFIKCVHYLEKCGVSHGDLQHGNIMVCNGQIKLVDYDGVFVPGLSLRTSAELGHANYQHPLRDENIFGSFVDRFSSIIIYISLKALHAVPDLWSDYENGDNLLFVRKDFLQPSQSKLIKKLLTINEVKGYVSNLVTLCRADVSQIPTLQDFINNKVVVLPSTRINSTNVFPANGSKQQIKIRARQHLVISSNDRQELLKNVGSVVEVVGKITVIKPGSTRFGTPYFFLNFGDYRKKCFTIVLWSEAITILTQRGIDIESYQDKWVSIVGLINNYKGTPEIEFETNNKINFLKNEQEAEHILKDEFIYVDAASGSNLGQSMQSQPKITGLSSVNRNNDNVLITIASIANATSVTKANTTQPSQPLPTGSNLTSVQSVAAQNAQAIQNINNATRNTNLQATNSSQQKPSNTPPAAQKGACYIATAVYGSYDHPVVLDLRAFRDKVLMRTQRGRRFICFYYKYSPRLVKRFGGNHLICSLCRKLLDLFTCCV